MQAPREISLPGRHCQCGALRAGNTQRCEKCQASSSWYRHNCRRPAAPRPARPASAPATTRTPEPANTSPLRRADMATVSISVVVLLGVLVWLLHRYGGMKIWQGLICALFGFYLATTSLAPQIRATVAAIIRALTGQG